MSTKRELYTLGHGFFGGEIELENGKTVTVKYFNKLVPNTMLRSVHVKDALEYIAACVCEEQEYNHILIRSTFHGTTIRKGTKVDDRLGEHITFDAKKKTKGAKASGKRTGHAYVNNVVDTNDLRYRYSQVELDRVRWSDERGSSEEYYKAAQSTSG